MVLNRVTFLMVVLAMIVVTTVVVLPFARRRRGNLALDDRIQIDPHVRRRFLTVRNQQTEEDEHEFSNILWYCPKLPTEHEHEEGGKPVTSLYTMLAVTQDGRIIRHSNGLLNDDTPFRVPDYDQQHQLLTRFLSTLDILQNRKQYPKHYQTEPIIPGKVYLFTHTFDAGNFRNLIRLVYRVITDEQHPFRSNEDRIGVLEDMADTLEGPLLSLLVPRDRWVLLKTDTIYRLENAVFLSESLSLEPQAATALDVAIADYTVCQAKAETLALARPAVFPSSPTTANAATENSSTKLQGPHRHLEAELQSRDADSPLTLESDTDHRNPIQLSTRTKEKIVEPNESERPCLFITSDPFILKSSVRQVLSETFTLVDMERLNISNVLSAMTEAKVVVISQGEVLWSYRFFIRPSAHVIVLRSLEQKAEEAETRLRLKHLPYISMFTSPVVVSSDAAHMLVKVCRHTSDFFYHPDPNYPLVNSVGEAESHVCLVNVQNRAFTEAMCRMFRYSGIPVVTIEYHNETSWMALKKRYPGFFEQHTVVALLETDPKQQQREKKVDRRWLRFERGTRTMAHAPRVEDWSLLRSDRKVFCVDMEGFRIVNLPRFLMFVYEKFKSFPSMTEEMFKNVYQSILEVRCHGNVALNNLS